MASFKAFCLAGVAALAATATTAHAADLLPPPPPVEAPYIPAAPVVGGGWYLRGDVGAADLQIADRETTFGSPKAIAGNGFTVQSNTLAETAFVGAGVGYQVNSYIRGDITGEYRFASDYSAVETTAKGCNGGAFGCADSYGSKIDSGVVLANGYIDLGTYYRITPYIGAGIGAAFNEFGGITDYNLTFQNGFPSGFGASQSKISLAYAFMAGFSYDLTQNLKLDFGYRYLNMGRVASGAIVCSQGGCPYESQSFKLYSHDIRLGLRYAFADAIPYAPRMPLVTRY